MLLGIRIHTNKQSNVLVLVYIHLYLYKHHKQLIRDEKSIQWYFSSFNPHTRPANHPSQPRQLASNSNMHTVNLIAPTPPANPNSAYSTNFPSPRDRIEFPILLSLEVALPKSMVPPQWRFVLFCIPFCVPCVRAMLWEIVTVLQFTMHIVFLYLL